MIAKYCTGLQHIGIPTDNPAGTEAFYEKLGFVTVYRTATASGPVIFTELGNLQLEIYQQQPARTAGAIDHIAIDVTDIEACYIWAQENGMDIISNGIESHVFWDNGIRYFIIAGPNAEKIEFCQIL